MANKNVAQLIKEATEAVKEVPEDLRAVAFQKAFDLLAGEQTVGGPTVDQPPSKRRQSGRGRSKNKPQADAESNRSQLDRLDRTAYPEVTPDSTALDNSLRILRAAHNDLGIDGLTAVDVAQVLTGKFRCSVTRQSVGRALNSAGKLVDRYTVGRAVIFRIMSAGEQHLSDIESGAAPDRSRSKRTAKRTRKAKPNRSSSANEAASKKGATKKKVTKKTREPRSNSARPGPKAAVQKLIDGGFFASPRTGKDIIQHLKDSLGHKFNNDEMSPTMLRLLREGSLTREKNSENQYEYQNA